METVFFYEKDLPKAAALLRRGELVAFPSETVYGLGAVAVDEQAVEKVYLAKGRPSDNPLIVHVDSPEMVEHYAYMDNPQARVLMERFWPGPLTIILPMRKGILSKTVTGGLTTAAFRMPNHPLTLKLIKETGEALVGPSANTSGKPSPTNAKHVYHDLQGKIAGVVDGGTSLIGVESTVIDLSEMGVATILRPGAITFEMLQELLPNVQVDQHLVCEEETPKSPGMKYKHYAPNAKVVMIDVKKENWQEAIDFALAKNYRIGLLADREITEQFSAKVTAVYSLSEYHNLKYATARLFDGLRKLDAVTPPLDIIFAQTFTERGLGVAYMNRLKKASGQKYFS